MSVGWLPRLLVAAGFAAAAGGCVKNDISLSIVRFVPPDVSGTACMYDATVTDSLARGVYDTVAAQLFGAGYTAAFVVQNNLEELMGAPVETQAYDVSSYNVTLDIEGPDLSAAIPESDRAFNYVNGSLHLTPGASGVGFAQIVSADEVPKIAGVSAGTILAHIQPVAVNGGETQVGTEAVFPVDICAGCLLGTTMLPDCPLMEAMPLTGNPCNPAADEAITCCQPVDATGNVIPDVEPLCGMNVLPQT